VKSAVLDPQLRYLAGIKPAAFGSTPRSSLVQPALHLKPVGKPVDPMFSRHKVADEKERKIVRNVASVGELKESYFAEIDESRLTR